MNKKSFLIGVLTGVLAVMLLGFSFQGQGLRSAFCRVFQCSTWLNFSQHVVGSYVWDPSMPTLEERIINIESQFPVTATIPQELTDQINAMDAKIDELVFNAEMLDMSIWLESDAAAPAGQLWLNVWIKTDPIITFEAFGIGNGGAGIPGVLYDPALLGFIGFEKGSFTTDWAMLAGNEINPGQAVVGGLRGDGTAIEGTRIGIIAIVKFNVLASGQVTVTLQNYIDNLEGFAPAVYTLTLDI